jgi:phosphomethylpyrimidine synthase
MKITQDVRDYAASLEISEKRPLRSGMARESGSFRREGGEIYKKVKPCGVPFA